MNDITPARRTSSLLSRILRKVSSKLRPASRGPIAHSYGNFSIELPANHLLLEYQAAHPNYDRFLPCLARHLVADETVVDVGANVGDTLAAMVDANPRLRFICIEADEQFFRHLKANIARILASLPQSRVEAIQALVGKKISGVRLDGSGGTKHSVVEAGGGLKSLPLDQLMAKGQRVRLLKSDVDGFDYDVLDSSMAVIREHGPLIFFECQFDHEHQKAGFSATIQTLASMGYSEWVVFDNFGEAMVRVSDISILFQLMEYVWRQNCGRTTRTIHYFDILAAQPGDSPLIDRVLQDYGAFGAAKS